MKPQAHSYTRLPGRAWRPWGGATLWRAADHVLQVSMRGYTEVYRRFYFADIQALTLQATRGLRNGALLWGVPATLAAVATAAGLPPGRVSWGVVASLFALPLAIHLARGAGCRCYVTTALETTELLALRRVRDARRTLAILRECVEASQGRLTAETFRAAVPVPAIAPRPAAMVAAPIGGGGPPALPPKHPVRWHRTLVALLACDAAVSAAQAMQESFSWADAAGVALALAEIVVALAAIFSQRRSPTLPRPLRRFAWAAFAYVNALIVIGWFATILVTFQDIAKGIEPTPFLAPRVTVLPIASIGGYLALAVFGLIALRTVPASPVEQA